MVNAGGQLSRLFQLHLHRTVVVRTLETHITQHWAVVDEIVHAVKERVPHVAIAVRLHLPSSFAQVVALHEIAVARVALQIGFALRLL